MSDPVVYVCSARGHYVGQVIKPWGRRWQTVTGRHAKPETAMAKAVLSMQPVHNRARVVFVADWYGPQVVMECKR